MAEPRSTSGGSAWTQEQLANAQVIINVGQQMGMDRRDIRIALMTSLQESGLRNLDYGDRDSVGLFQQRTSQGWGSVSQILDPKYSATKFYEALKGIGGRDDMRLTVAAQSVQRSAYPDAYAKWADDAAGILQQLGGAGGSSGKPTQDPQATGPQFQAVTEGITPTPVAATLTSALDTASNSVLGVGETSTPMDFSDIMAQAAAPAFATKDQFDQAAQGGRGRPAGGEAWRQDVRQYAKQFLGTPYVWGGTSPSGFDCSGFTQYVYKKFGINLPRISADQGRSGKRISLDNMKVGDLVLWDNSSRNVGADHVAIYIGHGRIMEAPRPGLSVQISNLYDTSIAWGVRVNRG